MSLDLILPALVLALMGWVIPRLLFHVFPEGVRPLVLLAVTAIGLMMLCGMAFFGVLYVAQGITWESLMREGWGALIAHFAKLGAISSLLWGPMLLLSVANLPRRWVREVW